MAIATPVRHVTIPQVVRIAAMLTARAYTSPAYTAIHGPQQVAYDAANAATRLCTISRSLHRLAEKACNVGTTEADDKREARLMAEASAIVEPYGLLPYHQGDPRGCALYIYSLGDLAGRDISSVYANIGTPCY